MKKNSNFYVFNIKLQTQKEDEIKYGEYSRIIRSLSDNRSVMQVSKNEAIQIYPALGGANEDVPDFIYGYLAKGTFIEGDSIHVLENDQFVVKENTPSLINPIASSFIFIPKKHRLLVEKKQGAPNDKQIEIYLHRFLSKVVDENDVLEIVLEKDANIIEQIYNANAVYKLSYEISYTNDDVVGILGQDYERILKDSKVGKVKVSAQADNKLEGLDIEGSIILEGGLELAKKDGTVLSADIIPQNSAKRIRVTNKDKPKLLSISIDSDLGGIWRQIYDSVIKML